MSTSYQLTGHKADFILGDGIPDAITYWAIRHKPTGGYLFVRGGRSFTCHEPLPLKGSKITPRLFHSRHAARCALTAWLKGRFDWHYEDGMSVWPVAGRDINNMEIVTVTLSLPE